MKRPPIPGNERERLHALERYHVLDTPSEANFDALTTLAASILDVPIALISLVDVDRQWFKSRYGLEGPQTARDVSFCGHVVAAQASLVVPDAHADERFADNPLVVGDPCVRFYAGMPLRTADGFVLGTLCVIAHEPREITPKQRELLALLAGQVVELLELRRKTILLEAERCRAVHSERELRAIIDTAVDAIITIDRTGSIARVNSSVERMFGYAPDELIGRNVAVLMPSPDRERHDAYITNYENTGQAKVIGVGREVECQRKDGSTFPADLSVSEVQLGAVRCFTGILRDISERRRVDRLKDEFVSTVSHELRTPLTSIRGSLGLVSAGVTGELPHEAKAYVDIALANTERLIRLINDLLDIDKLQAGLLDFRRHVCDLVGLVQVSMSANDALAGSHQTRLAWRGEVLHVDVVVDEDRLAQVLTNLISNAVKFSPAGSLVELSVTPRGNRMRVNVRDQGPGISDAFRSRVFQRFVQADGSDSRSKGGSGLGLSISKSLVERMHGTIGFEACEPGTNFFIDLPWLQAIDETTGPELDGRPLVLVCEGELDVAREMATALEGGGSRAHVAPTLERARQLLGTFRYDLVTLDLTLADGNADALVTDIRASASGRNVPIVIMSVLPQAVAQARLGAAAATVANILTKPVDPNRLLSAARDAGVLVTVHGNGNHA